MKALILNVAATVEWDYPSVPAATTTPLHVPAYTILLMTVIMALQSACGTLGTDSLQAKKKNPAAGVLQFPDGRKIALLPDALNHTGEATFTWPDGRTRSGMWLDGMLQGMGTETTPDEHYSGQWLNGKRHGHGALESLQGARYVGDFKDGLAAGRGTRTTREGIYQGSWQAGLRHGMGQFNGTDGTVYRGQWQQGMRAGHGRQEYPGGSIYEGDWLENQPHGFGHFRFPSAEVYEGSWVAGAREGYGTWQSPADLSYEGTWRNNQRNGFGRETRPDGSYYAGDWAADKKHGLGREAYPDGTVHIGSWQNDIILGQGQRTNRAGITIAGDWQGNSITLGLLELPGGPTYRGELFSADGEQAAGSLVQWLTRQAENKDPHAQYFLACMYLDFLDPEPQPQTARIWMRKAAAAGLAEAQFRLSVMLLQVDIPESLKWLRRAAEHQHPAANDLLGEYFHTGLHLEQDDQTAITHYELAAEQGSITATNNLAWLLATTSNQTIADPQRAVDLIRPFVLYLGSWQHLDTLAAAHARLGDTERARRMQHQALDQATGLAPAKVLEEMQARLDLYINDRAFIE